MDSDSQFETSWMTVENEVALGARKTTPLGCTELFNNFAENARNNRDLERCTYRTAITTPWAMLGGLQKNIVKSFASETLLDGPDGKFPFTGGTEMSGNLRVTQSQNDEAWAPFVFHEDLQSSPLDPRFATSTLTNVPVTAYSQPEELFQPDKTNLSIAHPSPLHYHTRLPSNTCSICYLSHDTNSALAHHAKSAQHLAYQCACGIGYSRVDSLNRHIRDFDLGNHPCPYCTKHVGFKAFKRKYHLTQHLKGYHKIEIVTNMARSDSNRLSRTEDLIPSH